MRLPLYSRIALIAIAILPFRAASQVSFSNGENAFEISGVISALYNYRILDPTMATNHVSNNPNNPLNHKKNNFQLATARINLQGMNGRQFEYRIQFDVAQLGYSSATGEFPAVLDAYGAYRPWQNTKITFGYQKIPYSANSLATYAQQPYWQRAEITRGDIFSRRDVGITVKQSFFNERINLYGGIYSGMGEYILTSLTGGDNDPNGKPEFAGRIDFSTQKLNYNDIYDTRNMRTPLFNVGFNARYSEKTVSMPGIVDYDLKIVSGTKKIIGADAAFMYRGFSAQFEIHQLIINPTNADTARLQGRDTKYFRAGGFFGELNYFNRKLKSGAFVRYDNFIPNDLIQNNMEQTLSFGYNFFLKGFRSVMKAQYFYRLDKHNAALLRNADQFRIGWQFLL